MDGDTGSPIMVDSDDENSSHSSETPASTRRHKSTATRAEGVTNNKPKDRTATPATSNKATFNKPGKYEWPEADASAQARLLQRADGGVQSSL